MEAVGGGGVGSGVVRSWGRGMAGGTRCRGGGEGHLLLLWYLLGGGGERGSDITLEFCSPAAEKEGEGSLSEHLLHSYTFYNGNDNFMNIYTHTYI
jgi:hypothetical protein